MPLFEIKWKKKCCPKLTGLTEILWKWGPDSQSPGRREKMLWAVRLCRQRAGTFQPCSSSTLQLRSTAIRQTTGARKKHSSKTFYLGQVTSLLWFLFCHLPTGDNGTESRAWLLGLKGKLQENDLAQAWHRVGGQIVLPGSRALYDRTRKGIFLKHRK